MTLQLEELQEALRDEAGSTAAQEVRRLRAERAERARCGIAILRRHQRLRNFRGEERSLADVYLRGPTKVRASPPFLSCCTDHLTHVGCHLGGTDSCASLGTRGNG